VTLKSAILLGLLLIPGVGVPGYSSDSPLVHKPLAGKTIVLDPGHAVMNENGKIINPGARARRGALERDVVLNVAEKLAPLLEAQGARVYMTRTPQNAWRYSRDRHSDNRSRAIFANVLRGQAYVRLHCDWNRNKRFKGFTTYYYRWGSRRLGKSIRKALVQGLKPHRDNGLHRRSFVSITARMPSVLIELGVLSYKPEGKELGLDAYQTRLAQAISNGIVDYFESEDPASHAKS
jgi:N-acetylmuramoyl-L-alanine amidase